MKRSVGWPLWGGAALLVVFGFWLTYQFVEPAPPSIIRMATGDPDGAYHEFAGRYRSLLEADGVTLELVPSAGAVENLDLLTRSEAPVDVAFVQGGVPTEGLTDTLASLGSMFYEPVWVFHRADPAPQRLADLTGLRVGVGAPGSGTRALALTLLGANGVGPGEAELVDAGGSDAARALKAGSLDAIFVIAAPGAGLVNDLTLAPGIELMSLRRVPAYVRRFRFAAPVALPEGVLDLALDRPPERVDMLAVTANLVVRRDLHPALVGLLLQAAERVHGEAGILQEPREFPSREYGVLPLDEEAERYYRYGPPFLQRYLPFWAANLVDRLKIMLLPLFALLIPLARVMPPVYQWRVRSRVYRWYDDLQRLDPRRETSPPDRETLARRLESLQALEDEVNRVRVPLSYTDELYHLRTHIELVRRDLQRESP